MADDRELWSRITNGDAEAFNGFYRENAPRLQAWLRQMVGDAQAAEDVAQETFTQLWERPNGYEPERGTLRAYLFGMGRRRAADWWRRRHPEGEAAQDGGTPCRVELQSLVGDALGRLTEEQRTLLWLREVEGWSYAELAVTLEVPVGTVRSRLFAARQALRAVWRGKREGDAYEVR